MEILDGRTQYNVIINAVQTITSTAGITPAGFQNNARFTNVIDLRGWRIDMHLLNKAPWPVWFHYAIVSEKVDNVALTRGFFRDNDTQRDLDFTTGLSGASMHNYPINPDRFAILCHKRIFIPRATDDPSNLHTQGSLANTNYRHLRWYEPFKRSIAFEDSVHPGPLNNIYAVYWYTDPMVDPGSPVTTGTLQMHHEVIAFFNDAQNG